MAKQIKRNPRNDFANYLAERYIKNNNDDLDSAIYWLKNDLKNERLQMSDQSIVDFERALEIIIEKIADRILLKETYNEDG